MTQKVARPGAALKAFRERKGWTLAEVSRRTGITVSTLSKVENGRVSLNFEKLSRLSAGLELDHRQPAESPRRLTGGPGYRRPPQHDARR